MKINIIKTLFLVASLVGLAGCNQEDPFTNQAPQPSGVANPGANYTLTAGTISPFVTVGNTVAISATLTDDTQAPVVAAPIGFLVDNGAFTGNVKFIQVNTDSTGTATVILTAPVLVGSGTITISYGNQTTTVNLTYKAGTATNISLNASPSLVGVSSSSTLTAQLQDAFGNPIVNEAMQFGFTAKGSVNPTFAGTGIVQTNSSGVATIVYTSGATASIAGVTDTISLAPLIGATPSTTIATNITVQSSATTIQSLTLTQTLASTSMPVGTTQNLTATVLDSANQPVQGLTVAFEVVGAGLLNNVGKLVTNTTDVNGVATVALAAPLLVDSASITASTAGKTSNISLKYVADKPASIVLHASPASIGVSSDSTLTAAVYDKYGNVTPGEALVFDFFNDPVANPPVVGNSSGGFFTPATLTGNANATTNSSGVATILYTSGTTVGGTDIISVTASNSATPATPATATVNIAVTTAASTATQLTLVQQLAGTTMTVGKTQKLTATVLDNTNQPVAGQVVSFQVVGAGTVDNGTSAGKLITATTLNDGTATVNLIAPLLVNSGTITASTAGMSATVAITYVPDTPAMVTLNASPTSVGISTDSILTALVTDQHGNVTPGEPVVFDFFNDPVPNPPVVGNSSGGSFVNATTAGTANATTDASGVATATYTSGTTAGGTDLLLVTVTNGLSPTATVAIGVNNALSSVASISLALGSPTTAITVGTTGLSVKATVLDNQNQPVGGETVTFAIQGGGDYFGGVKQVQATTGDGTGTTILGEASAVLNAPNLVGGATITATVKGYTASIPVTYIPDVPATVTLITSNVLVGVSSNVTLTATVFDQYGNISPFEPVVFSTSNTGGASFTPSTGNAQTDANGVATITYTSGTTIGTDTIRVDVTNGTKPSNTVSIDVASGAVPVPAKMTIGTDLTSIKSDNSTVATITAIVLDSANAAVPGATVSFTATGGVLSAGSVVTNANGQAIVTLSAGTDRTNGTITVTAKHVGITAVNVPVNVVGSTVSITPDSTLLTIGGTDTAILKIKAADASGLGIFNSSVNVSIDGASTGTAQFDITAAQTSSGLTNTLGEWTVNLTGTGPGTVRVVADALGATTFQDFQVQTLVGSMSITAPITDSTAPINSPVTFNIDVPAGVSGVTLVSSLGTWGGSASNVRTWAGPFVTATTISDQLTSSVIGTATINVADTTNTLNSDNIRLVFVDQIVDATSMISLQAAPTTVAPSIGTTLNSTALQATVVNANNGPIAGAKVTFSMANTTGSGEFIDPPVAYTDAFGVARATFYSGSQSTGASGLLVTADVWQTASPTVLASSSQVPIIVNGTVGSIAIGMSTTVSSINSNTAYSLPITLQLADSGGNPVPLTNVTLSLWAPEYALGYWACKPTPGVVRTVVLPNEDVNKNLVLDATEDDSGDGALTPPNSAAGSLPSIVTTDNNGLATFNLTYLKGYAGFINATLTATALVQGTETIATKRFWLGASKSDINGCVLGGSPLNTAWPTLTSSATTLALAPGQQSTITALLKDTNTAPINGATVTATLLAQGSGAPLLDGLTGTASAVTNAAGEPGPGMVDFVYTAGNVVGSDLIKLTYTTTSGVDITDYLWIDVK